MYSQGPIITFLISAYFNSRTPMGCDQKRAPAHVSCLEFQPTHPCGVRPQKYLNLLRILTFQLTHLCRVRLLWTRVIFYVLLFQLTHPYRVRRHLRVVTSLFLYFNSRTLTGCDSLHKKPFLMKPKTPKSANPF